MRTIYLLSDDELEITNNNDGTISITNADDSDADIFRKIPAKRIKSVEVSEGAAAVVTSNFVLTPAASPAANTLYSCILRSFDTVENVWRKITLEVYSPATALTQTAIANAIRSQIANSVFAGYGWTVAGTNTVTITTSAAYPVIYADAQNGIVATGANGSFEVNQVSRDTATVTPTPGIVYDKVSITFDEFGAEAAGQNENDSTTVVVYTDHATATLITSAADILNLQDTDNLAGMVSPVYKTNV
jgi:hypothetical protein